MAKKDKVLELIKFFIFKPRWIVKKKLKAANLISIDQ